MPRTEKQPDYQEFIKALHLGVGSIPRKRICIYMYKWTAWNHVPQQFLREIYRFQSSQSGIVVNPPVPVRHALRKELQTHDYLLTAKRVLLGKWKTQFIPFSK